MTSRYFCLSRPPEGEQIPEGHVAMEATLLQDHLTSYGVVIGAHGWVEYPAALPVETVWDWDLLPDDPNEFAHYTFFVRSGRNTTQQRYCEWEAIKRLLRRFLAIL